MVVPSKEGSSGEQSKFDLVRSNALLSKISETHLKDLAADAQWLTCIKGETIWNRGADVDWFGLISTGFVKMVKLSEGGKESVLEVMGPGQTFGCLGVIEGSGCPLAAQAITDIRMLKVPQSSFLPMYEACPPLHKEMLKVSTRRFFAKLNLMAQLSAGRVDCRIANVLLVLYESYGLDTIQGQVIDVPLTRQDLSDFTGVTVESAIRTLSAWQKMGLIRSDRSTITILDFARIQDIARN